MNALQLLTADHRSVEKHFKNFEKAGPRAHVTKAKLVASMIEELSIHAEIEELIFYPGARAAASKTTGMVLEALEEHLSVKRILADLEKMGPEDERFDAKVTVLIEQVRHHVEEEEDELFPQVAKSLSDEHLNEMGDALQAAKKTVPTRPHPNSPDTPPGNAVTGLIAGAVDRTKDAVHKATS